MKKAIFSLFLSLLGFLFVTSAHADAFTLSGKVTDQNSTPIQNTTVSAIDIPSQTTIVSATTDVNGNYSFTISGGTYDIKAIPPSSSNLQTATVSNQTISSDTVLNFILVPFSPQVTVSGHLRDSNNNPLVGVEMKVFPRGSSSVSTTTDGTGFYSLTYTYSSTGGDVLSVGGSPATLQQSFGINLPTFNADTTLDLQTPPQAALTIHVQDPNGVAVSGAQTSVSFSSTGPVTFNSNLGSLSGGMGYPFVQLPGGSTDSNGNVTTTVLTTTDYYVQVTPPNVNYLPIASYVSVASDVTQVYALQLSNPTPTPVPNQPPSINSIPSVTVNEGSTYSTTGSFTDPDSTSWTATVDYGDGSGSQPLTLNSDKTFSLSHQYLEEGNYTVTVSVTDNQGVTGQQTATVAVNDVNPTVSIPSPSANPVQINTPVTFSSTFSDAGTSDVYSASWSWGDGNTSNGTITQQAGSTPGTVIDNHTYTNPGVYTVTLTVTDGDGGSTTQTFQYLSVYNPTSQGLFSAGSKFTSPAGAYAANPNITGDVLFGLSYKYQGTMPIGDRQFTMNFKQANFTFNATDVSSLVISNGIGTLTGSGTINGETHVYNFLVTGSETNNTIRIQITDPSSNNNVIYDTQPGASATAAPITPVSGKVLAH